MSLTEVDWTKRTSIVAYVQDHDDRWTSDLAHVFLMTGTGEGWKLDELVELIDEVRDGKA